MICGVKTIKIRMHYQKKVKNPGPEDQVFDVRTNIYNCHRSFRKGVPNSGTGTGEEGFMDTGHKLVDPEVGLRIKKNRNGRLLCPGLSGSTFRVPGRRTQIDAS